MEEETDGLRQRKGKEDEEEEMVLTKKLVKHEAKDKEEVIGVSGNVFIKAKQWF